VAVPNVFSFHSELSKYEGVVVVEEPKKFDWGVKAEYETPEGTSFSVIESHNPNESNSKKQKLEKEENRPSKLDWVVISTTDVKKSIAFYTEMFGFSVKMESPGWSEVVGSNGTVLGLMPVPEKSGPGAHLAFNVSCLQKFHEEISKDPSIHVRQEPKKDHGVYRSGYINEDGTYISVLEEEPKEKKATGNGICHVDIACESLERARKFYESVFGWSCTPWGDSYLIYRSNDATYSVGGGIFLGKERQTYASVHMYVPDVDCAVEKIKAAGGTIVKEKFSITNVGFIAHFKDTEGNIMGLYSR